MSGFTVVSREVVGGRWGVSKGRVGIGIEWVYGGVRLIVYGLKTFYFV